jgi:hypothetical protein
VARPDFLLACAHRAGPDSVPPEWAGVCLALQETLSRI